MDLSVIVPIYNEQEHIQNCVSSLAPVLDEIVGESKWEFIFVNNGSVDKSEAVIEEISKTIKFYQKIYSPKPNYGEALFLGLKAAKGDYSYVINVDAWDPIFLSEAWTLKESFDIIVGSKRIVKAYSEIQWYRRLLSWGLNTLLKIFLGFKGTDTHGLKLLRMKTVRPLLDKVVLRRGQFDTELTLRAQKLGLKISELPVRIKNLRAPRNLMIKKIAQNILDLARLWWILKNGNPQNFNPKILSVHDASPKFQKELEVIFQDRNFGANVPVKWIGVVPCWGGKWDIRQYPEFIKFLNDLRQRGWELVLHGYTHSNPQHPPFYKFLFKSDEIFEFHGLTRLEAERLLDSSLQMFQEAFGFLPRGFIPPNWSISRAAVEVLKNRGFEFLGKMNGIYWLQSEKHEFVMIQKLHIRFYPLHMLSKVILGLIFNGGHVVYHPRERGVSILGDKE